MNEKDPFEILGVHEDAGQEEIELAYESRCIQYHPERYAGRDPKTRAWAAGKMQETQDAYRQLILLGAFVKFCEHTLSADPSPPPPPARTSARGTRPSRREPSIPARINQRRDVASVLLNPDWDWSDERVYAYPNIPHKKLAGAISAYAPNVSRDQVIILLDDTVFGGAREGVLVTNDGIYCKELGDSPEHRHFDGIKTIEPGTGGRIMINRVEFFKAVLIDHFVVAKFVSRLSNAI